MLKKVKHKGGRPGLAWGAAVGTRLLFLGVFIQIAHPPDSSTAGSQRRQNASFENKSDRADVVCDELVLHTVQMAKPHGSCTKFLQIDTHQTTDVVLCSILRIQSESTGNAFETEN